MSRAPPPLSLVVGHDDHRIRIVVGVAQVTIYIPDDLRKQLQDHKLPVSAICQAALKAELTGSRRGATNSRPLTRGPHYEEAHR